MCGKGNDKCGFLHMMENGLKVGVDKGGVFLLFSTLYPFILHLLSTCFPYISPLCFPHGVDKVLFGCLVVLLFVQTYYLSLTTKLQANEPRQRKKL